MLQIELERILPIEALIRRRLVDLDLTSVLLVQKCGYRNVAKGLRRLASLRAGSFDGASQLVGALPEALEIPGEQVHAAIEQTKAHLSAEREAAWRAAFVPHAIILTERERPSQITMAALCGFDRLKRIEFPEGMPNLGYNAFVKREIEARLADHKGDRSSAKQSALS